MAFPIGTFSNGTRTHEFKSDGSDVYRNEDLVLEGGYTVTGNQIAFEGKGKDHPCQDIRGSYTWGYDGNGLSFEVVYDKCGDRSRFTHGTTWYKKP